jgi:ATP-binding cassette, subfamily B, bacterial
VAITESLRNIELVKSMGLTWPEIRRLKNFTKKIFDLEISKVKRIRTLTFLQSSVLLVLRSPSCSSSCGSSFATCSPG